MPQFIKKGWAFCAALMSFVLNYLPNWLPESTKYAALNKALDGLRTLASYRAPVLNVTAVLLFFFGIAYFALNRKQEERPLERKYQIGNTICRVHAKSNEAFRNSSLILTQVRCAKEHAKFEYHGGRDAAAYICNVCGLQLSEKEYKSCKAEAESLFVREFDPINKVGIPAAKAPST